MSEAGNVYIETALHYFRGSHTGVEPFGVVIEEAPLMGHLVIRGDAQSESLRGAIQSLLGLELPQQPCTFTGDDASSLYWLGPSEWLLIIADARRAELLASLRSEQLVVVDVSGGQTLVKLSGADVANVLMKSSGYDFHLTNFAPGSCVQTTFAKAAALVAGCEDGSFDLVIRRSFADYLARWLLDAGEEFGCHIP